MRCAGERCGSCTNSDENAAATMAGLKEVGAQLGLHPETLRNWSKRFANGC